VMTWKNALQGWNKPHDPLAQVHPD
jgi:hypothetical protein